MRNKLLWCGAAGPALFTLTWLVLGAVLPDYSPTRHWISSLSLAGGVAGALQVGSFLVSGTLIILFAAGLRRTGTEGPASTWGPRWVGLAGAGLIAAGVFTIDPALGYPPVAAAGPSWHGSLHDVAGLIVFTGLTAAPVAYARRWRPRWSVGCAGLVAGLWVTAAVLAGLDYAGVWTPSPAGLAERASVTVGMAWMAAYAVASLRSPAARPALSAG